MGGARHRIAQRRRRAADHRSFLPSACASSGDPGDREGADSTPDVLSEQHGLLERREARR